MKKERSGSSREVEALEFASLVRALGLLALDARSQVAWLDSFGLPGKAAYVDELAQEFSQPFRMVTTFVEAGWMQLRSVETLQQIDEAFGMMSESSDADVWDVGQLEGSDQWRLVRMLAARALVLL